MKNLTILAAATLLAAVLAPASPSQAADLCLQFDGMNCDLSGDAGFFRFQGAKLPKNVKKATKLNGRACGTGTVTGTASMIDDPASIHLSAFYICDASPGLIEASFAPGDTTIGSVGTGRGSDGSGQYQTGGSCTVTIVDCTTEP